MAEVCSKGAKREAFETYAYLSDKINLLVMRLNAFLNKILPPPYDGSSGRWRRRLPLERRSFNLHTRSLLRFAADFIPRSLLATIGL